MDDAERKLMELLRAKRVHMLIERDGVFEEVPDAIYEHAVAVNARGSVEPDAKATERDQMREHVRIYRVAHQSEMSGSANPKCWRLARTPRHPPAHPLHYQTTRMLPVMSRRSRSRPIEQYGSGSRTVSMRGPTTAVRRLRMTTG